MNVIIWSHRWPIYKYDILYLSLKFCITAETFDSYADHYAETAFANKNFKIKNKKLREKNLTFVPNTRPKKEKRKKVKPFFPFA